MHVKICIHVYVCVCVYVCAPVMQCVQRPEEAIRAPVTEVADSCYSLCGYWELNLVL